MIVVAAYQHDVQARMAVAPCLQTSQRGRCPRAARVQEVAEYDQLFASVVGQQVIQPRQVASVVPRGTGWCNAR